MTIDPQQLQWRMRVFDSLSFPTRVLRPDGTIVAVNDVFLQVNRDVAEHIIELNRDDPRGPTLKITGLYQLDRLDEAISVGLGALEISQNFGPLYAALVWTYADIGRWNQALDMGEQAVSLDPTLMDTYRAYAYALTWVGARDQAAQALEAAIAIQPTLD
ncbi:MAG: tetratricopeptide repeat protein, partial [Desulfofustis sp.]|nr:tetratricopeptide repeat protein [Desulfofustis sp.]